VPNGLGSTWAPTRATVQEGNDTLFLTCKSTD
jgi:hypothetical protein